MKIKNLFKGEGFVNFSSSILAIVCGLLFGLIILLISNPSQAFGGFMMIIQGGFTDGMQGFGQVLYMATPLIMTGLSVGFAFKTGLFNIGASGQFTAGAFAAVYVGVKFTFPAGSSLSGGTSGSDSGRSALGHGSWTFKSIFQCK